MTMSSERQIAEGTLGVEQVGDELSTFFAHGVRPHGTRRSCISIVAYGTESLKSSRSRCKSRINVMKLSRFLPQSVRDYLYLTRESSRIVRNLKYERAVERFTEKALDCTESGV